MGTTSLPAGRQNLHISKHGALAVPIPGVYPNVKVQSFKTYSNLSYGRKRFLSGFALSLLKVVAQGKADKNGEKGYPRR
jgi:hypothetical protein